MEDQTDKVYFNPAWIAANGGRLHSNNVLFYFATSPFFDQLSSNQDLVSQWGGTPEESSMIGTRAVYEGNLRKRRGIQFVIVLDPLESKAIVQGPHGPEPSNVWVIRKQLREGETDNRVTILDYYYIVDDVIYQSPSVAGVLACRMLNTVTLLSNMMSKPSHLVRFSATQGHTYYQTITKSTAQSTAQSLTGSAQESRETTPMPSGSTGENASTGVNRPPGTDGSSMRTLSDALQMTLRYGKDYMDEMPLVGEPGNFRFSKPKDANASLGPTAQQRRQGSPSKIETPAQSRPPSAVPVSQAHPP